MRFGLGLDGGVGYWVRDERALAAAESCLDRCDQRKNEFRIEEALGVGQNAHGLVRQSEPLAHHGQFEDVFDIFADSA
jgi:hypothetical protein